MVQVHPGPPQRPPRQRGFGVEGTWRSDDDFDVDPGRSTGMAIVRSRSASDGEFDCTVRTGVLELGDNVEVWRGEKLLLNWASWRRSSLEGSG